MFWYKESMERITCRDPSIHNLLKGDRIMKSKELKLKKARASAYAICVGAATLAVLSFVEFVKANKKLAELNEARNTSNEIKE